MGWAQDFDTTTLRVPVVASPSVLAEDLADDVGRFLAQHPAIRVIMDERVSAEIVRALREGAADLGVRWDVAALKGLQCTPYRQDPLCLALPRGYRWARRTAKRFAQVLDEVRVSVAAGGLMDVPPNEPWALRRFVICTRADGSATAAARQLVAHLARQAEPA